MNEHRIHQIFQVRVLLNPHFSQPVVGFGVSEAKSRVASRVSTGPANRLFFAEVRKAEEIRRFPLVLEKRVRNAGLRARTR